MDISSHLSEVKKQFSELLSICDPKKVSELHPTAGERIQYADLLRNIRNHIDSIESDLINGVLNEGAVQRHLPKELFLFYKEKIQPRYADLDCAFKILDPSGFEFNQMFYPCLIPSGEKGRTQLTFEYGVEKIQQIIDDDSTYNDRFSVSRAYQILESNLINFAPDEWLDNASYLRPIRTSRNKMEIPVQVRMRMIELNRSYVFGNWLSVLTLARSILEYAILDTLHKFGIDSTYGVTLPIEKEMPKRLSHLIDEVSVHLPSIKLDMESVRDYGNIYTSKA